MVSDDLVGKIKSSPDIAEKTKCCWCQVPMNMTEEVYEVEIKGRKYADGKPAKGVFCDACHASAVRMSEGPKMALRFEGDNEDYPNVIMLPYLLEDT